MTSRDYEILKHLHNAKLASIDSIFPGYPELHNKLVGK